MDGGIHCLQWGISLLIKVLSDNCQYFKIYSDFWKSNYSILYLGWFQTRYEFFCLIRLIDQKIFEATKIVQ